MTFMDSPQYITQSTLEALDIDLEGHDIDVVLADLNETLQERVGAEITEALNDEQLAELVELQENASEEALGAWLEEHVPEMQKIVQNEIDILLTEIVDDSEEE